MAPLVFAFLIIGAAVWAISHGVHWGWFVGALALLVALLSWSLFGVILIALLSLIAFAVMRMAGLI